MGRRNYKGKNVSSWYLHLYTSTSESKLLNDADRLTATLAKFLPR
jgi:hypothetical protein